VNLEAHGLLRAAGAGVMLALILVQSAGAPHVHSGRSRFATAAVRPDDPYLSLENQLQRADPRIPFGSLRDPFSYLGTGAPRWHGTPVAETVPTLSPRPVVTAIVWDADPRVMLRLDGHDYTVRTGSVFADYQVVSISQDQVSLAQGDVMFILTLPQKGR